MKLYIHPMSSNARRARMTAMLLGQQVEYVFVDLQKGAQKSADYLALNPNGRVPTLVDGDVVLWESLAIMQYLCDKTPGQTLYPTDLARRAHVNKWLFWAAAHWGMAASQLNFELFLKKMFGQGEPNDYVVGRMTAHFTDFATVLDAQLARTRYITGDALSIADLAIAAPLMYKDMSKLPVDGHAHVMRWFGDITALDAWKQTQPA